MARAGRIVIYVMLLAEAAAVAAAMFVTVRLVPFARWSRWLRRAPAVAEPPKALVARLKRVMRLIAPALPATSRCLVCAVTARTMLARRGYASRLSLGLRDDGGVLSAHAWLAAGPVIVTGNRESDRYHRVATF